MIPGSNILSQALSVLGHTSVNYFQYAGRITNAGGVMLTTYSTPILVSGSVQPVKRSKYETMGLDFEKNYITWFVMNIGVIDLERDVSGDVIETLGRRWQLVGLNNWYQIDGWKSVLGIDIGAATGLLTNA